MTELPQNIRRNILSLLGVGGEPPAELVSRISALYSDLKNVETPRSAWKTFDVETGSGTSVTFDGAFSLEGGSLASLLCDSKRAVLVAVTLGASIDRHLCRLQAVAMDDAVIFDACASAEIEAFCDRVEGEIAENLDGGSFLTMRFSPGYGDVPLGESEKIISALGAQKSLGLTVTKSGMLFPTKSITAVTGITGSKQNRARLCSLCGMGDDCTFKKRGDTCGL